MKPWLLYAKWAKDGYVDHNTKERKTISNALKVRADVMPNGTAAIGVTYKTLEAIMGTTWGKYVPLSYPIAYTNICAAYDKIISNPAIFHLQANLYGYER